MSQNRNHVALYIDPLKMFMPLKGMPLPIVGADQDMKRAAAYLKKDLRRYDAIVVALDTHPFDHIAHAFRWLDRNDQHPATFTVITSAEYEAGLWRANNSTDQQWQGEYLKRLEATGRVHTIWPVHGVEDDVQYEVYEPLLFALKDWERVTGKQVQYVKKGMHRDTEHFGMFVADVPIAGAPETQLNQTLIEYINSFKAIDVFGEASSHCVMDSVKQFMANVAKSSWQKITVFRDCMSSVAAVVDKETGTVIVDFPAQADAWFRDLDQNGVTVATVTDRMAA